MILVAGLSSVQNTAQNGTIIDELNISLQLERIL
jgi:hypothetical protein